MTDQELDDFLRSDQGPALRGFVRVAGEISARSERQAANLLATLREHGAPPIMEAYRLALLVQALVDAEAKDTRMSRADILKILDSLLLATEPSWVSVSARSGHAS